MARGFGEMHIWRDQATPGKQFDVKSSSWSSSSKADVTKTNTYFLWEMRIWPPMFLCSPYCLKVYSLTFFKHCNWKLYIFGKCSCRPYSSEQFVLTSMGLFMWVRTGVNVRFETVLYLSNLVLSNVVWWSLEVTLAVIYGKKTF